MNTTILARQLTREDAALAHEGTVLLNRTQGQGLFGPSYLIDQIGNPDGFVVAAFSENQLVGVASVQTIVDFDYYLPFDPGIARKLEGKLVASFNTASVVESLQGKGIGRLLMERRLSWVLHRRCEVALGVSWISGLPNTSKGTFLAGGFRAVAQVDDFYRKSSAKNPFDCPGCRQVPCVCGAILFRKDFRS